MWMSAEGSDRSIASGSLVYTISETGERRYCGQAYETQSFLISDGYFYYSITCYVSMSD